MIARISQVVRTDRTAALRYDERDRRNQNGSRSGGGSGSSLPTAPVRLTAERYAFGEFACETAQGLARVLTEAQELKQAAEAMLAGSPLSALDRRTTVVNPADAAEVQTYPGASLKGYTIQIKKAASAQLNEGHPLPCGEPTAVSAGSNQMKLTINGKTVPLSVYIIHTDTNQQALEKLCAAVQRTGCPVEALLVREAAGETVRLELSSRFTGACQAFALSDVYGNAAAVTGMDTVSKPASDALYRINGGLWTTSDSNQISLDCGNVTAVLKESSREPVHLFVVPDKDAILSQVGRLIDRYNGLHQAFYGSSPSLLNGGTGQAVLGRPGSALLAGAGISRNADGSLRLDSEALELLADTSFERLESSLRGPGGLAAIWLEAADRLLSQPSVQLLNPRQSLFQAFTNYRYLAAETTPLQTYLPVPLSGMLLNGQL